MDGLKKGLDIPRMELLKMSCNNKYFFFYDKLMNQFSVCKLTNKVFDEQVGAENWVFELCYKIEISTDSLK